MVKQVIVMRKDLNMRKGKMVAQGAHAAISFITKRLIHEYTDEEAGFSRYSIVFTPAEEEWIRDSFTKVCVYVNSEQELKDIIAQAFVKGELECNPITDNGTTEFHGVPTLTCCAIGPDEAEKIDIVTGQLKLL